MPIAGIVGWYVPAIQGEPALVAIGANLERRGLRGRGRGVAHGVFIHFLFCRFTLLTDLLNENMYRKLRHVVPCDVGR